MNDTAENRPSPTLRGRVVNLVAKCDGFHPFATRDDFIRWMDANCHWCRNSDIGNPGRRCGIERELSYFQADMHRGLPCISGFAASMMGLRQGEGTELRFCARYDPDSENAPTPSGECPRMVEWVP